MREYGAARSKAGYQMPSLLKSAQVLPLPSRRVLGWGHVWRSLEDGLVRRRQRRLLLALDDRMLKDIGLSLFDAAREAAKRWQP